MHTAERLRCLTQQGEQVERGTHPSVQEEPQENGQQLMTARICFLLTHLRLGWSSADLRTGYRWLRSQAVQSTSRFSGTSMRACSSHWNGRSQQRKSNHTSASLAFADIPYANIPWVKGNHLAKLNVNSTQLNVGDVCSALMARL